MRILGLIVYYVVFIIGFVMASQELETLTLFGIIIMFVAVDIKSLVSHLNSRHK